MNRNVWTDYGTAHHNPIYMSDIATVLIPLLITLFFVSLLYIHLLKKKLAKARNQATIMEQYVNEIIHKSPLHLIPLLLLVPFMAVIESNMTIQIPGDW